MIDVTGLRKAYRHGARLWARNLYERDPTT
jgi:hypothetical protein